MGRGLFLFSAVLVLAGCSQRAPSQGPPLPTPTSLSLSPGQLEVGVGQPFHLAATAMYADGSRRDVSGAAFWATPPDAGLRLETAGNGVAESAGTTSVEAEWGGLAGHARVQVVGATRPPAALALMPREAFLRAGEANAFAAVATTADGGVREVTAEARWETSNAESAALLATSPGFLLAAKPGRAEVQASLAGLRAEAVVRVSAAVPSRPVFPLHVSPTGRFLVDAHGLPFRLQGEGAWSLIANLTAAEVDTYLEDRQQKGFNTVLVNLVEHRYADKAPNNRAGAAPFRTPGDFSAPVEAYFDFAEAVVEKARARGMLFLLVPAYPGYGCPASPSPDNEGWSAEMGKASPAACRAYGRYVGGRFSKFENVLWVHGGDCLPQPGSTLEACALQVREGIREAGGTALETGHFSPNTTSMDEVAFAPFMQLDAVYQYQRPQEACRRAYARSPPLPAFLVESGYENERIQLTTPPVRKYLYRGSFTCTAGVVFGSRPVWLFGEGWKQALDSPGANDVARLGHLLDSLPWEALVPSGLSGMRPLVTAGGGAPGAEDEVVAAATPDGRTLLAYVPPGNGRGGRDFVVDVRALSGPATARWYNPWTGATVPLGSLSNETPWWFTTPGDNGSGYDDWVLVLTRASSVALTAPEAQ